MSITARGFTIVEFMIIIVIIGILAAIGVVSYRGTQERAEYAQARSDLKRINDAIVIYHSRNGIYPVSTSWVTTATPSSVWQAISPAFIDTVPVAKNGTYQYRTDVNGSQYKLVRVKAGGLSSIDTSSTPSSGVQPNINTQTSTSVNNVNSWGYWSSGGASL